MKNKNNATVIFDANINGKRYEISYPASYLRKLWEDSKGEGTAFKFKIPINGEEISFTCTIEEVMKQVRKVELQHNILPWKLDGYLIDLTQTLSQKNILREKGRDEEIKKIWSCLSKKNHSNAILVGDTDVGKTTTAYEIARQIAINECPVQFTKSRVLMINTSELLKIENEFVFKSRIEQICKFIIKEKENIIIYVDNLLHMKYDIKLIELLHKILVAHNIKFMSSINHEDFEQYFEQDNSIIKYINQIEILEPEPEELFSMIEKRVIMFQKRYKVKISKKMVEFAIATARLSSSVSSEPGNVLNILDRAFSEAKRKGKKVVDKQCILGCYNTYLKLYHNTSLDEKKMIAYHEVGHYILFKKCNNLTNLKIDFVSILPMLDFLGVNSWHAILGKNLNYTREYYEDLIAVYLGGRVGEEKITNKFSTGAISDLNLANSFAREMIMVYGLSNKQENKNRSYVNNYYFLKDYLLTEKKKEEIENEIQEIIEEGFKKAESVINDNLELLERLANELVEKEILLDEELEKICKEYEK